MELLIRILVNGLALGGTYALVTLGLSLIFSVVRLINFAYGVLIAAGGYIMYATAGIPWILQAGLVIAGVALLSLLMDRLAFSPIRDADGNTLLVTSFAITYFLQNLLFTTIGSRPQALTVPAFLSGSVHVGPAVLNTVDLASIVAAVVALAATAIIMRRTDFGLQLRAAAEDFTMMELLGVKAGRLIGAAFALSGALAGIASLFYLAKGAVVTPTIGDSITLVAFVAVVVGGLGSLAGSALGGLLIGILSSALQITLPDGAVQFRDAILFTLVIIVLLVRPQGLVAVKGNQERV